MNYLIDIGHPAHVHYFRNLYSILQVKHHVIVTCKSVPIIINLLTHYDIPFIELGSKGSTLIEKINLQVLYAAKMRSIMEKHKIDIAFGVSALIVHAAKFTKTRTILFDDDDQIVQPFTARFVTPFAEVVVSPDTLKHERIPNGIYYPGYHELAYLHPKRFSPDSAVLAKHGLIEGEKYFILRFNAFKAHHDIKEGGMNMQQKRLLIQKLSEFGKVFITTEAKLDDDFESFKLPIAPHEMHDFIYYSQMLVSDSQTMSSEAAVLGVPAYRCNSFVGRISYLEEEEKRYGLIYGYLPHQFDWMMMNIAECLHLPDIKVEWKKRKDKMLLDKIDVTAFWCWFIENYPESKKVVKSNKFDYNRFM